MSCLFFILLAASAVWTLAPTSFLWPHCLPPLLMFPGKNNDAMQTGLVAMTQIALKPAPLAMDPKWRTA
jgi:hypothetical protein